MGIAEDVERKPVTYRLNANQGVDQDMMALGMLMAFGDVLVRAPRSA